MPESVIKSSNIFRLPNEILLGVFSLFPTIALLPFTPTCKSFQSLIFRVLHHRLQAVTSLDDYVLYSELFPPHKQYTNTKFFCQSLGTPNLQSIIEDFNAESTHVGHGDKLRDLYSCFRPVRREPDLRAALRHPAGDIPGSRTYKTDDSPLFDGMLEEDNIVSEIVTVEASNLFCQLMAACHLVKRNRHGRLDSTQCVSEGWIRVWREWLAKQCETKSWTDGDVVVVHHDMVHGRGSFANGEQYDLSKNPSILWLNSGRNEVGLQVKVKERKTSLENPIVQGSDVDVAVSYKVELKEVYIRTTHLLLRLEEAQRQRSNYESGSTIFSLFQRSNVHVAVCPNGKSGGWSSTPLDKILMWYSILREEDQVSFDIGQQLGWPQHYRPNPRRLSISSTTLRRPSMMLCVGLTYLKPNLSYDPEYKILYRNDLAAFSKKHVTTIGFAGGGHEPMFGGFVGHNYLSAYVSGNVFASPTAAQIFEAIKMCQPMDQDSLGTLVVCGNYTGDILNAGLAITRAQAAGYKVHFVPVGDDVAVGRKKGGKVGRRGLSGHLIALKSACAMAQRGESLERVAEVMEYVAGNVGTIGVAFDRVALPNATLTDLQALPPATIELGMGAHGEPGLQQISPVPSPEDLIARMVHLLLDVSDTDRAFIPFSKSSHPTRDNEVVMLLNSLGSTSDEVLARFAELAIMELERQGFVVRRVTLGPLVTSLKMSGFGITIWRLPPESGEVMERQLALQLWDEEVDVVAWRQ
nr:dihydroxyacetone kinase 1 [Quercus suber]